MEVVDIFSCVSSSATVIAAGVAACTMWTWRSQFVYQRKYECILDLRSQLYDASDAASYLSSLREHFSDCIRRGVGADSFDADSFPYALQKAWWDHLLKLHRTWALMEVTLNNGELKSFSINPNIIDSEMRACVQEILNLACAEPPAKLFHLHRLVSDSIISVTNRYKVLEEECRMALLKIK